MNDELYLTPDAMRAKELTELSRNGRATIRAIHKMVEVRFSPNENPRTSIVGTGHTFLEAE